MRSRARVLGVVFLAAALASAFSAALAYQAESARGFDPVPWRLALLNASFWYGWVVLAVPLVILSARLRLDRAPRIAVPAHIAAVVAAALTHVALQSFSQTFAKWYWVVRPAPDQYPGFEWLPTIWRAFPIEMSATIDWEITTGAAIVGIAHAAFYHSEAQQRALHEAQLETRLVESQLQMLQHQLHPHFLFNTLHAISALMHRDVQAADRMLSRLSDLLRLTLDSVTRPEIRLFEEMEFLEKYASIEQVRMGDRLAIEFDVDADVLDAAVPALVLQPLVENAIKHGIAPSGRPGRVAIGARRDGEMLIMTVDDTGSGPNERAMAALSTGIGVSNTRARLTHQFGSRYRFEFQRHPNGFTVLVGIPYRQEPAAISIAEFVA
ncbi:MAG TPA: histidine kinase [Vicinamibacterales bacterium]|nr:histidine kinase [Vicinamibacterales bacterium]